MMNESKGSSEPTAARFSTLEGVFTPCTLTILGVIMFLRFGQVVGHAGIIHTIAIVQDCLISPVDSITQSVLRHLGLATK